MPDAVIAAAGEKMAKAITALSHEFSTVRTGRFTMTEIRRNCPAWTRTAGERSAATG